MKVSKLAVVAAGGKSKTQMWCGWLLTVFALIGLSAELSSPPMDGTGIVVAICMLAGGLTSLIFAFRTKRLIGRFRLYVNILTDRSSMSISELAQISGDPEQRIMADLQAMINRRFFAAAYIDKGKKRLVFPLMEKEQQEAASQQQYDAINCPACGGVTRIVCGTSGPCMYCGHNLQSRTVVAKKKKGLKDRIFGLFRSKKNEQQEQPWEW